MDLEEIKSVVDKLGYRDVRTAGGWIPLKAWEPYGGDMKARFHFDAQAEAIVDETPAGEVSGVWRIRK